jgi:hypothetical protein
MLGVAGSSEEKIGSCSMRQGETTDVDSILVDTLIEKVLVD